MGSLRHIRLRRLATERSHEGEMHSHSAILVAGFLTPPPFKGEAGRGMGQFQRPHPIPTSIRPIAKPSCPNLPSGQGPTVKDHSCYWPARCSDLTA